ncbi:hypothetical protein BH18ACT1_BH18ACT1_16610 [soil metagenome]
MTSVTVARRARGDEAPDIPSPASAPRSPGSVLVALTVAGLVAVGVVLRFLTRSDLWLDEALTVHVARLPVGDLLDALGRDGHPPLYYLLLHGWMALVGEGDLAVRALSGVFAVAALPVAWLVGRRYAGPLGATAALVLLATSPYAVRYATEARMYSLVVLLVLLGWLALRSALDEPTPLRLLAVAGVSALLLLTHYWSLYLLGAVATLLVLLVVRGQGRDRQRAVRALGAMGVGALAFLPWLPTFLRQAASTGTPWGAPSRPAEVVTTGLIDFGGGPFGEARVLGGVLAALALLGVFGRAVDRRHVELDLSTRPRARPEAAVLVGTMGLAVAASWLTATAFASRHLAVAFPLLLLLAALGVTTLASARARAAVLAVVAALGLVGGAYNVATNRTQAATIADAVEDAGTPGDLVLVCPDQLGPGVTRYMDDGFEAVRFPDLADATLVDWRDYAERQRSVTPAQAAAAAHERAGERTVWLAWTGGLYGMEGRCEALTGALRALRPVEEVVADGTTFEHAWLFRYDAP